MYNKTLLILLSGKAGVGKTYSARILCDYFRELGLNVTVANFAFGIKKIAKEFMGWDGQKDERGRKLLQTLGTEVGRAYNINCWVEYLFGYLEHSANFPYDVIIIDDWRFPSEYEYFVDNLMYNTMRVKIIGKKQEAMPENLKTHASEISLPEDSKYYDFTLYNNFDPNMEVNVREMGHHLDSIQSKFI